jgi:hypothetical protein
LNKIKKEAFLFNLKDVCENFRSGAKEMDAKKNLHVIIKGASAY